jgi:transcriptional regulator with XRE-family HTH domain
LSVLATRTVISPRNTICCRWSLVVPEGGTPRLSKLLWPTAALDNELEDRFSMDGGMSRHPRKFFRENTNDSGAKIASVAVEFRKRGLSFVNTLRNRIRQARRLAGLSRASLARHVGVSSSAAGQWEHPDGTSPSLENLLLIAKATKTAFEWLVSGTSSARPATDESGSVFIHPDAIARDLEEERLLALWRKLPDRHRETFFAAIAALSG